MLRSIYRFVRARLLHRLVFGSRREIWDEGRDAVEVVGFFHSASGLGESARLCALQLHQAGVKVLCTSVEKMFLKRAEIDWRFESTATAKDVGCRIFHLNPPMMPPLIFRMGLRRYAKVYNIGYWAWELEQIPSEWAHALRYVNAVFCPSDFTSQAIRKCTDKPVLTVPHPVVSDTRRSATRTRLGLSESQFVVASVFSFGSALERKNPYAAVDAFIAAFGQRADTVLILKSNHGDASAEKDRFLGYIGSFPNIRLIDEIWEKEEVLGLIACADVYLSLHRSEGFGLTIAEAMIAGTPTVVTDWSGSRDFCNSKNSYPVPYSLIEVKSRHPDFRGLRGAVWADPDPIAAASILRSIEVAPAQARAKAKICINETNRYFSEPRYIQALRQLARPTLDWVSLGGFKVLGTTASELATRLLACRDNQTQATLFFANTNFIVQCQPLRHLMTDDVLIVNDGVGMDIAARLLRGVRFQENLNGTDFLPYLFRNAAAPLRVYLIGGKPEIVARASRHVSEKLGQVVVGYCDGYTGMRANQSLVETINQAKPDVVLVALGNPIQERWILDHRSKLDTTILAGVGALFDFWAAAKPRAPLLVQRLRMEWFYRLCLEPRRLMRRYTIDIAKFFQLCYRYRSAERH